MKPNPKISAAVAAILWAPSATIVFAAPADTAAGTGGELQEVVVTAERRTENLQDVPITIQAISGDQLKQLSVTSFNDLLKYTPNVSFSGNGPGTGSIFMRGLGSSGSGNQSLTTTDPFPNVAVYLDEQSMQFPARNNDVYLVDMERVEILEGPQGTLFGGGAQAGAIRYITNKPNFNGVSGEANIGYGITAHGDPNTAMTGVFNLPLGDSLAVRAVAFSDRRGGYIDNPPNTIGYFPGTPPHDLAGNPIANNGPAQGTATNPLSYQGARISALWKANDAWDVLLQQNYQNMRADGYFYAYPANSQGVPLANYQIAAFDPAFTKDKYESTAITVNGKIGDLLSVVYAGSYMSRHIDGQQDYSNYMRSVYGSYYACIGNGAGEWNPTKFPQLGVNPVTGAPAVHPIQCSTSVGSWRDQVSNTHQSHELRISTPTHNRLRGVFGAFWEKFVIFDQMDFNYLNIPQCDPANLAAAAAGGPACLSAVGPVPGSFANDPHLRENMNDAFGQDLQRGYKQLAFFASVDFDLIPKVLTLNAGTRHYDYDEFEFGSEWFSETTSSLLLNHPNGACTRAGPGLCGFPINLSKSERGFASRASLAWHATPEVMAFYTYSQGFRPGGFNRTPSPLGQEPILFRTAPYCGPPSTDPRCLPGGSLYGLQTAQTTRPVGYSSDTLSNNELGFKSEFLNHRLLINASAYRMRWNDVQSQLFDPSRLGTATWVAQGPSYTIKGVALQLVARITEGLTLQGSSSWNSSSQSGAPCLRSAGITATPNNPTPAGQCITIVNGSPYTNPWEPPGSSLPYSPPSQFNLQARYEWNAGAFRPFATVGVSHIASMHTSPQNFPDGNDRAQNPPTTTLLRYTIPGYTTYDGALGVSKDGWTAQITGSNLTNAYGPTNISSGQFIRAEIPLRPRVVMAQFLYTF